jgi:precorrin-6B methylase 2
LGDAVARLEDVHRDPTDFAPTISVINTLIDESALIGPDTGRARNSGWADPLEHARMLHDNRRTGDYLAALVAAVRPGDVVLDIGTGSGVLSVAAARAGARRVYAVEATDIGAIAAQVFVVNGVEDRVTLLTGWSRQIELPEKADLLVAEIIGNEPLEEEILETTLDARQRLLKPGARLIPHALTLLARPVQLPEAEIRQRAYGRAAVERWRDLYGIDFQPLLDAAMPGPVHTITEGEIVATWPQMGPPVVLGTVDLAGVQLGNVSLGASRSGRGRSRLRAPSRLQPQGGRNTRWAHLRDRRAQSHLSVPGRHDRPRARTAGRLHVRRGQPASPGPRASPNPSAGASAAAADMTHAASRMSPTVRRTPTISSSTAPAERAVATAH